LKRLVDITNVAIGLGAAIFGGLATKLAERFIISADKKVDAQIQLREELWREITSLKSRVVELERQSTEWREKYFELLEKYGRLELDYKFTKIKYEEMEIQLGEMRDRIQVDITESEVLKMRARIIKAPTRLYDDEEGLDDF
jgi:chromosome segregation ATPase